MRTTRKERRLDVIYGQALVDGQLLDVTDHARHCGIDVPVAISRSLWNCFVHPFPGALPRDYLPLDLLLADLAAYLQKLGDGVDWIGHFTPNHRPEWLCSSFAVRVRCNFLGGKLAAIALCCEEELFTRPNAKSRSTLPGTILVRLSRLVRQVNHACRTAEAALVHKLSSQLQVLVNLSPLAPYAHTLAADTPTLPEGFTIEQYRAVLVTSLEEQLMAAWGCSTNETDGPVWKMIRLQRVMQTPLSELAAITERLLRMAGQLTFNGEPVVNPFRQLLAAYHRMTASLDEGATLLPGTVLLTVRQQFSVVEELADPARKAECRRLRREFDRIDAGGPLGDWVDLGGQTEQEAAVQ